MTVRARRKVSYDPRCFELAKVFLSVDPEIATEANADELAQVLQSAIEGFIKYDAEKRGTQQP
jgi:hypothetical protein